MVSEEMEMNHVLADQGIECLESDMGEFIVQLDHEKPSHIILPAIHKNAGTGRVLVPRQTWRGDTPRTLTNLFTIGRKVLRAEVL